MKTFDIFGQSVDDKTLRTVVGILKDGGIIIYPTDTLYAIGCDALNNNAINRICKLKGINPDKQYLSVICSGISMAAEYARFDNAGFKLLKRNTPGPFTFIFPSSSSLPKVFKGRKTVGVRIPNCKIALSLAEALGNPLMTTTISYEDSDYATNPELIAEAYDNHADCFINNGDGGTTPSTVVDCTGEEPKIIREGAGELSY